MQSLIKSVDKIITNSIEEYIQRICDKYDNVDHNILLDLWFKSGENRSRSNSESRESKSGCPYVSSKGKNSGQVCGTVSKDGSLYCSAHKKYENKEPKEKKILPEPKSSSKSLTSTLKPKPKSPETKPQIVLRKHKQTNHFYHPESNLVIKSAEDRIVIGKIVNDTFQQIEESDIDLCKKWGFQYEMEDEVEEDEIEEKKSIKNETKKNSKSSKKEDEIEEKKSIKNETKKNNSKKEDEIVEKKSTKKKEVEDKAGDKKTKKEGSEVKKSKSKKKENSDSEIEDEFEEKKSKKDKNKSRKRSVSEDTEDIINDLDEESEADKKNKKHSLKALGLQDDDIENELEEEY